MKKISLFLFSLLMMFSLCIDVNAIKVDGEGYSGISSDIINSSGVKHDVPGNATKQYIVGVRISFVRSTGEQILSKDYLIRDSGNSYYNLNNAYAAVGANNKVSYNGSDPSFVKNGYNRVNAGTGVDLQRIFSTYNFNKKIDLSSINTSNSMSGMAYRVSLASEWFDESNYSGRDYQTDLVNLLIHGFGVPNSYLTNEEELKHLFFVIEPTTAISIVGSNLRSSLYYGTEYELAKLAVQTGDTSSDALSGTFYTMLRKSLPCAGYLKGDLLDTIEKANVNLFGFENSYFNNSVYQVTSSMINKCNTAYTGSNGKNSHLDKSDVTGKYGVGITIVWFYDKISFDDELKIPTCPQVNDIVKDDSNNYLCTNEDKFKELVNKFNTYVKEHPEEKLKEISVEWYKSCGCKDDGGGNTPSEYNCTPQYSVGTCSTKYENSVYYKDSSNGKIDDDYWEKCVFNDNGKYYGMNTHKTSSAGDLSYLDNSLGSSRYCPVYCIEEIKANFDYTDNIGAIMTGRNFVWPNNTTVTTSRTCRAKVTEESWEKFNNEVNSANKAIEKAYYDWQFEIQKQNAYKKYTTYTESRNCPIEKCKNVNTGESEKDGVCFKITYSDGTVNDYCGRCESIGDTALETTEYSTLKLEQFQCYKQKVKQECTTTGYKDQYVATTTFRGETWTYSWCAGETPNPDINVAGKKKDYDDSLKVPSSYVDEMNKCYGLTSQDIINSSPQLQLNYNQGGYDYTGLLEIDDSFVPPISNVECKDVNNIPVYIASSGEQWKTSYPTIYKCEKVEVTNTITQSFHLNSEVYRYVLKTNQTSINASDLINYPGQNYIDIGYGNLPVKFGTPTGIKENGLVITYSKLGNIESSYANQTDVDKILESLNSEDYHNWSCNYSVIDDIFEEECIPGDPECPNPNPDCPPGDPECPNPNPNPVPTTRGLRLIYRPIDLKNPFPDINGEGRNTGSNWCYYGDCSNNNQTVQTYITNKTDIYSKEPMYTFELTPVAIKEIRKYNNSKDENNQKRTYSDFNLICETGTGKACVSNFLTEINANNLNGNGTDFKAGGKCMVQTVRTQNSNNFYSCQN